MDDHEVFDESRKREAAVRQLKKVLSRCREVDLTTNEILAVVRSLVLGEDGILIEGGLLERLTDDEATTVIRLLYESLADDATFTFLARRTPAQIHPLCDDAGIRRDERTITVEAHQLRVTIQKVQ